MDRRQQRTIALCGMLALGIVPVIAGILDEPFYVSLFSRIMIFAIAAVSLDLIMGFGGLLSFGHAVYLGIGAYSVGILTFYGINNGFVHFSVAILGGVIVSFLIGVVSLRTSGGYFIMITLAFAQMFFFLFTALKIYGGDDGLNIPRPSNFGGVLNFGNPTAFYYAVFSILALAVYLSGRITESRFGMVLRGAKLNERRMAALGFPTFRYRLAAFVMSGAVCSIAGALLANLNMFVSPAVMQWVRSGELMIMSIVGGSGTLFGPVVGAVFLLVLEDTVSSMFENWQLVVGPILLICVLFARHGITGLFARRPRRAANG